MKKIEIEWEGKKEQVLYKPPTRGERKQYLNKLNEFKKQLSSEEETSSDNLEVMMEFREDFALSKVTKAPFDVKEPDNLPVNILKKIAKAVEGEMVIGEDFRDSSNTVQNTEPR